MSDIPWFSSMVLYQVYPRSFQDSNGDGVGDLNGIRQRLEYLNHLGVDCIWISPFYPSPMKDFGYDIADYCGVDPVFGTLEDFDNLLSEAHGRGIRVMVDLVPNHSSDQHPWFQESRQSRDNEKSDWYIWRDAKQDGSPPNNWLSRFGGSVWEWSDERQQYYLHSFLKEQPDLNWESPAVQQAMTGTMRFWLDKGVDGFRVDAIDFLGKDPSYANEQPDPDYTPDSIPYKQLQHDLTRNAGNFFDYLRMMADTVGQYEDRLLILESYPTVQARPEPYWQFYKEIGKPFCVPFNFELILMDWSANDIQKFIDDFESGLHENDYPVYVLGNHDNSRFASKVGPEAARAGAMLLLTLPGINLIYNGEEIGMHDVSIPESQRTDPDGRDKSRTPMQWSAEANAGFSDGQSWLPVAPDFAALNVESENNDQSSMLTLYRRLIDLKHSNPILKNGSYQPGPKIEGIVSFERELSGKSLLILLNLTAEAVSTELPKDQYGFMLSTKPERTTFDGSLEANEGIILECL